MPDHAGHLCIEYSLGSPTRDAGGCRSRQSVEDEVATIRMEPEGGQFAYAI